MGSRQQVAKGQVSQSLALRSGLLVLSSLTSMAIHFVHSVCIS